MVAFLCDIIGGFLSFTVNEEQYTALLDSLTTRACECYHDNQTVHQLFQQHGWTGNTFDVMILPIALGSKGKIFSFSVQSVRSIG